MNLELDAKGGRLFFLGALVSLLLATAVLCAIWVPELTHWHGRPAPIGDSELQVARTLPERRVLDELGAMQLGGTKVESDTREIVAAAEHVTRGTLTMPGFPPTSISLPFSPRDLVGRGPPTWELNFASLAAADLLLDAYAITGRDDFFRRARDVIVAFAEFESARWVDYGYLWNDHAIAARVPVLLKFWAEYRSRRDYDPRVGRIVVNLVIRSALLLAKPSFYAWNSDHGVMADLAILQIAAAFPNFPEIAELKAIAVARFGEHLAYYIGREGVTLLHSAGYHSSGLYYFAMALRLFTLNGIAIPGEWWAKYAKATEFYAELRRPDGTLPMFGDTRSVSEGLGPPLTARGNDGTAEPLARRKKWSLSNSFSIYPVSGEAILWDGSDAGTATQTVMTWSNHPGLGHKLADELSLIIWARGRTWLTNAGYWPYGQWGRDHAESWEASNAPHLLGESKRSERTSRVRSLGDGEGVRFIDIEREGPGSYRLRRQVVRLLDADSWIVLDYSHDSAERATITNWTFFPDLSVTTGPTPGQYRVAPQRSATALACSFSGSDGVETELVIGREAPFAGWVVNDRTPMRAAAIVVRQPSRDSWSLATFTLTNVGQQAGTGSGARMEEWLDGDHWTIAVPIIASGPVTLTRDGDKLFVRWPDIS